MNLGWIGTGAMGLPMAQRLVDHGFNLRVYNRTPAKLAPLVDAGAARATSPARAASGVEVVVTMVSNDEALRSVTMGSTETAGLGEELRTGGIHVAMSTTSPRLSEELTEFHAERDQIFVAAPVFGRPETAASGDLAVVCAGDPDAIETCRTWFDGIARQVDVVSETPSAANVVKLAGNLTLASAIASMGEAATLVERWSIDPGQFLSLLNRVLYQSPVYGTYGELIAGESYEPAGFEARHGLKDVELALDAARRVDASFPVTEVVRKQLEASVNRGWGTKDWSVLKRVANRQSESKPKETEG